LTRIVGRWRVGGAALREQHARRADREWKEEIRAGRVSEEEFWYCDRDVVGADAEDTLAVTQRGVRVGTVRLDDAFRPPGRAAAEQPHRRIVTMGVVRREVAMR
jgi:hypothetical protein